ncbi:MAG: ribbon-helix-helix domain-containing protein [Rhodospirillaceae bacterium]|nr:ribbon-helix-helix domain-containing protein [Rhodospirillaceae bacterium]
MCQVFASQDPDIYSSVTRSVRLDGFSTSIRLEALFWSILDQIAEQEGMSTPRFISTLYGEVLERRGEVGNFTSLLRVTCAVHIERQQGISQLPRPSRTWVSERPKLGRLVPVTWRSKRSCAPSRRDLARAVIG